MAECTDYGWKAESSGNLTRSLVLAGLTTAILAMTTATLVSAARGAIGMATGTTFAAVILSILLDRLVCINDT